jgi:colanic acid biosynthesis glycosyl transferase WcaI
VKPRTVLFLSPFFYPEAISTGKYNSLLVQAMVQRGVQVDVVCSHPLYPSWKPVGSDQTLEGTTIYRGGAWMRYPRSMMLRRIVFELWFACYAGWKAWRIRPESTTTVAVFPPSLFFLLVCHFIPSSNRRIGIVHDLQGVLGFNGGGRGKRWLYSLVHAVERKVFQSCDSLIVLSHAMARSLKEDYGVAEEKIIVRYPFVTLKLSPLGQNLIHILPDDQQHVVYSGALGKKQNPAGLYEFFRAAALQFPDAHFHIFSGGPAYEELRKRYLVEAPERISFHDLVDEPDLEELYARSTIQLIPQLNATADACLPSKLPNILAAGSVLLVITQHGAELPQIIEQTGSGVVAYSWEGDELLSKLNLALQKASSESHAQRRILVSELLEKQFSLDLLVTAVLGDTACEPAVARSGQSVGLRA